MMSDTGRRGCQATEEWLKILEGGEDLLCVVEVDLEDEADQEGKGDEDGKGCQSCLHI